MLQELISPLRIDANDSLDNDAEAAYDAYVKHTPVTTPAQNPLHGFFPIADSGFWHGGVHLEAPDPSLPVPVQAIADGELVAYRVNHSPLKEQLNGKEVTYSNAFALLRHAFVTPAGDTLRFFSLYMHLHPFNDEAGAADSPAARRPSLFLQYGYRVATTEDRLGLTMHRPADGTPFKTIPKGKSFIVLSTRPTPAWADGSACWEVMYDNDIGLLLGAAGKAKQIKDAVWEVTGNDPGLNVHESDEAASPVRYVAPKGTRLHFKNTDAEYQPEFLKKNAYHQLVDGGYVYFGDKQVKVTPLITALPDNQVVVPEQPIPVIRGEVLGYPGLYLDRGPMIHFEIFAADTRLMQKLKACYGEFASSADSFSRKAATCAAIVAGAVSTGTTEENDAAQTVPAQRLYLKLKAGAVLSTKSEQFIGTDDTLRFVFTPNEATRLSAEEDGVLAREVGLPVIQDGLTYHCVYIDLNHPRTGWIAENDAGVAEVVPPYAWENLWRFIEEIGSFSNDAFCDAGQLFSILGLDTQGEYSPKEIFTASRDPVHNQWLKRLACIAPSEWAGSADGSKWARLKQPPWNYNSQRYNEIVAHIKKLQWWDQTAGKITGLPDANRVCHYHPVGFTEYLNMFSNPYDQTQECQGSEAQADNLKLGFESNYRRDLLDAAERTGLKPWALAALINVEAGAHRKTFPGRPFIGPDGRPRYDGTTPVKEPSYTLKVWDPEGVNRTTHATGLTQFMADTWLEVAAKTGTLLYSWLKAKLGAHELYYGDGQLRVQRQPNGPKEPLDAGTKEQLLALRSNAAFSIHAAADLALINYNDLTREGFKTGALTNDYQRGKLMYLLHHDGLPRATQLMRGSLSEAHAKEQLVAQVGEAKANSDFSDAGSWVAAYRKWLFEDCIDGRFKPEKFVCDTSALPHPYPKMHTIVAAISTP